MAENRTLQSQSIQSEFSSRLPLPLNSLTCFLFPKIKFTTSLVGCGLLEEDQAVNPSAFVDIARPAHTLSSLAFLCQGRGEGGSINFNRGPTEGSHAHTFRLTGPRNSSTGSYSARDLTAAFQRQGVVDFDTFTCISCLVSYVYEGQRNPLRVRFQHVCIM